MNNKMKIIISTFIIFLFSSASLFTYYQVYDYQETEEKYIVKTIKWDDFNINKPQSNIKIYNTTKKEYEDYHLDSINFNEVVSSSKDILKEVKKYSNIKLEKDDFPDELEFDNNTMLKLSNIIVEPNFKREKQWYEELESQIKTYSNLENADLINIPKEIHENNETWFLLSDTANFYNIDGKYSCNASYHRIKRVEEEKTSIDRYIIKAIYSGKKISNTGNVSIKYKLVSRSTIKEVLPRLSLKLLSISTIILIVVISIILLCKSLSIDNKKR